MIEGNSSITWGCSLPFSHHTLTISAQRDNNIQGQQHSYFVSSYFTNEETNVRSFSIPHAVQVLCLPRFYEGFLTMGLRIGIVLKVSSNMIIVC